MDDQLSIIRHAMLGQLTVIKNALSFVLEGHAGEVSDKTREFLKEAYKRSENLITMLLETRGKKSDG